MVEIRKGIYGLPQAGIIANNPLQKYLGKSDYFPCPTIPGVYKYKLFDTTFTLVVDDFGIKYTSKGYLLPILNCLRQFQTLNIDWKGELYIGLTLPCLGTCNGLCSNFVLQKDRNLNNPLISGILQLAGPNYKWLVSLILPNI